MLQNTESTHFDTLTPIQLQVLESLVAGHSVTAAANEAGIHRTTVHLWTRTLPHFARALLTLRQQRADRLVDELGDLSHLAINTFRQILSDDKASASVRLKAAMEIVKLCGSPTPNAPRRGPGPKFEKMDDDLRVAEIINPPKPAPRSPAMKTTPAAATLPAPAAVP